MKFLIGLCVSLCASLNALPALAYDFGISVHVTQVEVGQVPNYLDFKIDVNAGSCGVGTQLWFNPPQNVSGSGSNWPDSTSKYDNMLTAASALMSAELTGKTISIFGYNNGCSVTYFYINNI